MISKTRLLVFAAVLCLMCMSFSVSAQVVDLSAGRWVDLSHEYSPETIYWPTADGFEKETVFEGMTEGGWFYTAYNIKTAEHGGTHIDAPIHFAEGRQSVDEIPLYRLIGQGVVVDVAASASVDDDYQISVEDIKSWETQHGEIPGGAIVLFKTGFFNRWPDAHSYMGTADKGPEAVARLHFPGIHPDTAEFLVRHRSVASVGIDTPSIDFGQSKDFMSHRVLFDHDIPGFENLANLDELPAAGSLIVALPMKIKGGSGGPLRIVAFVPER